VSRRAAALPTAAAKPELATATKGRGVAGRRDAIKMTDDEMRSFLEAGRDLQVASINADGTPHLVTMWYVLRDGELAFWTYRKSQKVMNLRRDPRLSVLVATGDKYEELKGVSIIGRAEIVDDPDAVLGYGEAVYERYWGPLNDTVMDGVRAMGAKRVVIVVKPEKILSWDHGKLGGAY
jgi:PPOX class probable F420-dependent enzyme